MDELRGEWLRLTREVLPARAREEGWPLRFDHCFMRVALDQLAGRRWDEVIERPAIRHLTEAQLREAVSLAGRLAAEGEPLLREWDAQSLAWRRAARARRAPVPARPSR